MKPQPPVDPIRLFSDYMSIVGVPSLDHEPATDPDLAGKTLGLINGASWISLWSCWFGRLFLQGVKLVNAGNEAVQLNFMRAHRAGEPVPPQINIGLFAGFAVETAALYPLDAILITCSTMNRAHPAVRDAVRPRGVPVVQIDEPMMEKAVSTGARILAIATHGPTVENTKSLLLETAGRMGKSVAVECAVVEEAFALLGEGDIRGHNEAIARAIRDSMKQDRFDVVVLAQLSMSVFAFSYADRVAEFGAPVLTSGEEGFTRMREVLRARPRRG